ncbi:MarR family winged helix-turn-helix transcriptional regulator [Glycomyces harbinensis]|uniref:DNA-binding transcriptional regulator, MarR family n=1 Tax=Glycomyces harbinensis TaxID=58114 RepID=A0A1G6RCA9_9ACTN|nr:MarR family transcriptional regulator [Glycomyces harbinensis]SDD02071.1 DNA-binding transcriptional regulator, MarR family [Glycomyces harbinensis]
MTQGPGDTATDVTELLRRLTVQLRLLNHQVSDRIGLQDVDLECLDLISRTGPLTPSALARAADLHPATVTGVADRLEKGGWIRREKVPADRRAVHLVADEARGREVLRLYEPLRSAIGEICAGFEPAQLAVIARFLDRAGAAGRAATDDLTAGQ